MSERRFLLAEVTDRFPQVNLRLDSITESELIRRLNIICDEMHSPSKSIDILLHGEGDKDGMEDICGDWVRPSPTPTRQEWAEWASRVADSVWGDAPVAFERLVDAILSMPIVPKE